VPFQLVGVPDNWNSTKNPNLTVRIFRGRFATSSVCAATVAFLSACGGDISRTLITVYGPTLAISIPIPAGWSTEVGEQAGFAMQIFTGPSLDVPERPGIRVQVMAGPMPGGRTLDEVSRRYIDGQDVSTERGYSLHGFAGRTWYFHSKDGAEGSRLMLTPVEGTLYGIYAHGEAATVEAYDSILDAMWEGFSVERKQFFEIYVRPELSLRFGYPRSWQRTKFLGEPGKSFFIGFRSPPLALEEGGTTVHATLEVSVNTVPGDTTLEAFYTERTELLGDNYRVVRHEKVDDGRGISDLYSTETQLASYLERTFYFVEDGKSYVYKFITHNVVYAQIEPWIEEIAKSFQPLPAGADSPGSR
jgi:hypothetical protein